MVFVIRVNGGDKTTSFVDDTHLTTSITATEIVTGPPPGVGLKTGMGKEVVDLNANAMPAMFEGADQPTMNTIGKAQYFGTAPFNSGFAMNKYLGYVEPYLAQPTYHFWQSFFRAKAAEQNLTILESYLD